MVKRRLSLSLENKLIEMLENEYKIVFKRVLEKERKANPHRYSFSWFIEDMLKAGLIAKRNGLV